MVPVYGIPAEMRVHNVSTVGREMTSHISTTLATPFESPKHFSFEWSELKLCRLTFSKSGKSAMEVCMCVLATILPAKLYVFKLGSPIGVSNWDSNWD